MKVRKIMSLLPGLSLVLFVLSSSICLSAEDKFGELTKLADQYGTDKGSYRHKYTEVYEYFFYPIKDEARKICEIGIGQGASLKMFRDYFPNAVIYGIDINAATQFDSETVKTFVADQANRQQLKRFINTYGNNFDIILDDGGHNVEQQQISFGYLFKYVKPGGYYIIEDVDRNLWDPDNARFGVPEDSTSTMINNFVTNRKIESKYMTAEEKEYLNNNISYCNLLIRENESVTCIFKKK